MCFVPFHHFLGVFALKKDTTDACYFFHLRLFVGLVCCDCFECKPQQNAVEIAKPSSAVFVILSESEMYIAPHLRELLTVASTL